MDIINVLWFRFWTFVLFSLTHVYFCSSRQFSYWLITLNLCRPGFYALLKWISGKPMMFPELLQLDRTQPPNSIPLTDCLCSVLGLPGVVLRLRQRPLNV